MCDTNNGYLPDSHADRKFIFSLRRTLETVSNRARVTGSETVPVYIINDLLDDIDWYLDNE